MDMITVSAKTLDEAITKALLDLQTTSEHLHYEIIQKESSGFLGLFGAKPCVIRARVMGEEEERALKKQAEEKARAEKAEKERKEREQRAAAKAAEKAAAKSAEKPAGKPAKPAEKPAAKPAEKAAAKPAEKQGAKSAEKPAGKPAKPVEKPAEKSASDKPEKKEFEKKRQDKKDYNRRDRQEKRPQEPKPEREEKPKQPVKADPEVVQKAAKEFLEQVFAAMGMQVSVETSLNLEEGELQVMMAGDDMGILIGKRGQTLDSLQYLVSLVVNKETEGYLRVKLDTENYRERRKETLETLARNISYKVKRTKRPVSLEPMNPYERRIIHSALQNDRYVVTRSEGEDPYRHVVISLKRDSYNSGRRDRYNSRKDRQRDKAEKPAERTEVVENTTDEKQD